VIRAGPAARAGAFFDVDGTLVPGTSCDRELVRALRRSKQLPARAVLRAVAYSLGAIRWGPSAMWGVRGYLAGMVVAEFEAVCHAVARERILPRVAPHGLERIAHHRAGGDVIVLMTGAPVELAEPLGAALRADVVVGGRLDRRGPILTGWMLEPTPRGHEKVRHVRNIARRHGVDLEASWAYANTLDDVPHMALTGHPIAVNPGPLLIRAVPRLGWPVEYWPGPGSGHR